jgi:hypothetical protein
LSIRHPLFFGWFLLRHIRSANKLISGENQRRSAASVNGTLLGQFRRGTEQNQCAALRTKSWANVL